MDTESLIVARLGERQRKLSRIKELEKSKKNHTAKVIRVMSYAGLSVAACVAIVFAVMPGLSGYNRLDGLDLATPSFAEYRGGSSSPIEEAIQSCDFATALELTDESIAQSELSIKEYRSSGSENVEESKYMIAIEKEYLETLIWTRIYVLVQMKDEMNLIPACEAYLEDIDFQLYRGEVEKILKKIK